MAEHYGNTPRITYEFPDCSMPMAFDTYNNCSFGCMYCFAQNQRGIGSKKKEYLHKEVKDVSVERIKRMFIDPDKHGGDFAPYIKARKVMQWGSMSDQFDNFERKYGTTLELLRFFKDIDYPLCFSTKGAWFTKDERYMDLIRGQKNWNFKFSIITSDAEKARVIERGVESPQARLEAIERIANAGAGGATLRLRPFIIGVSTPTYLDLIKEAFNRGGYSFEHRILLSRNKKPDIEGIVAYHQQDGRFRHSRILQEVQRTVRLSETEPQGQRTVLQEHEGTVRPAGNALLCIGRTLQGTLPQRKLLRIAANVELQQGADVRSTEHLQAQGIREVERHQAGCRDFLEGETGKGDEHGNKREKFEVLHDERSRLHEVVLEQSAGSALAIQDVRRGNDTS